MQRGRESRPPEFYELGQTHGSRTVVCNCRVKRSPLDSQSEPASGSAPHNTVTTSSRTRLLLPPRASRRIMTARRRASESPPPLHCGARRRHSFARTGKRHHGPADDDRRPCMQAKRYPVQRGPLGEGNRRKARRQGLLLQIQPRRAHPQPGYAAAIELQKSP